MLYIVCIFCIFCDIFCILFCIFLPILHIFGILCNGSALDQIESRLHNFNSVTQRTGEATATASGVGRTQRTAPASSSAHPPLLPARACQPQRPQAPLFPPPSSRPRLPAVSAAGIGLLGPGQRGIALASGAVRAGPGAGHPPARLAGRGARCVLSPAPDARPPTAPASVAGGRQRLPAGWGGGGGVPRRPAGPPPTEDGACTAPGRLACAKQSGHTPSDPPPQFYFSARPSFNHTHVHANKAYTMPKPNPELSATPHHDCSLPPLQADTRASHTPPSCSLPRTPHPN